MVPGQLEENQSRCRFPSRNEQCGEGGLRRAHRAERMAQRAELIRRSEGERIRRQEKTEGGGQRSEVGGQRSEDRKQRTESRCQRSDD